jgi:hypothetical protein
MGDPFDGGVDGGMDVSQGRDSHGEMEPCRELRHQIAWAPFTMDFIGSPSMVLLA